MFLNKIIFSILSILSIPIMLIGINGGYFPAICRVCSRVRKYLVSIGDGVCDKIFILNVLSINKWVQKVINAFLFLSFDFYFTFIFVAYSAKTGFVCVHALLQSAFLVRSFDAPISGAFLVELRD